MLPHMTHLICHHTMQLMTVVTKNIVYATSLHIIPNINQKKDFTYTLPKDLTYKLKKVSAYKLVENTGI